MTIWPNPKASRFWITWKLALLHPKFHFWQKFCCQTILWQCHFSYVFVQANGVPQGSVLLPTLFPCTISDILPTRNLKYSLYPDDCALWHSSNNAEFSTYCIQLALGMIHNWSLQWGFKFCPRKSIGVFFSHRRVPNINLTLDSQLDLSV